MMCYFHTHKHKQTNKQIQYIYIFFLKGKALRAIYKQTTHSKYMSNSIESSKPEGMEKMALRVQKANTLPC